MPSGTLLPLQVASRWLDVLERRRAPGTYLPFLLMSPRDCDCPFLHSLLTASKKRLDEARLQPGC